MTDPTDISSQVEALRKAKEKLETAQIKLERNFNYHTGDEHFYLNSRLDGFDRKLSEYADFYTKCADFQSALDKLSERIGALEETVVGRRTE